MIIRCVRIPMLWDGPIWIDAGWRCFKNMRHKGHNGLGLNPVKLSKRLGVTLFKINSFKSALRAALGWPLMVIGLYMILAVLGSMFPVNADWQNRPGGTLIYLHDNGVHTSIILPNTDQTAPPRYAGDHFLSDRLRYPWVAVGWGDREFYLNTPTWSDLSPQVAVTALIGSGQSLVHEDRLETLNLMGELRPIRLSDQELNRLLSHLDATRARNVTDDLAGYGFNDRFLVANDVPHYSIFYTCNNWVSDALGAAGLKTGRWTPLPFGVMWWY